MTKIITFTNLRLQSLERKTWCCQTQLGWVQSLLWDILSREGPSGSFSQIGEMKRISPIWRDYRGPKVAPHILFVIVNGEKYSVWKKQFSPSFFFLLEVILFFLNVIGGKKKQTQELMNILVKIIIIEPRRASCTEIRLFAILPPSKGTCQPFSSWVLWMGSSQSSLLQLYKQLNINWTRKADWPCGEKRDSPGTRGPSSALSFEPAKVNLPDLLLSCWPWSPGIFYLYCCCLMSPLLSDLLNIKQLLFPQN